MLLELLRRQQRSPNGVRASSRDLASACKVSRSNVQHAVDALASRSLITTREGTATSPATHRVNITETARMGGPATGPPPGVAAAPPLALFQGHPGPLTGPPPTENTPLTAAAAALSISSASALLIDRVLSAKAKDFDQAIVSHFRAWLHGYMSKLGRDDRNQPIKDPHPPTDDLVAQFLAIADPRRLGTMLDSLLLDRQTCYSYGWFVTVALQRVHGIHFREQKEIRAALVDVKRQQRYAADAPTQAELLEGIRAAAEASSLPAASGDRRRRK